MTTFEAALAEAQAWLDRPGIEAIGEGEEGGERVIDVWVRDPDRADLPTQLHGVRVRIRPSGGAVEAL